MAKQQTLSQSDVEIEQSPMHLLHRVGQCATDVFQAEMAGADLTARQFAVLASIARREGASQTDLVEMTGIDRSTLADIVRRMLKKGLVQRRRTKEDARAYAVKLTEEGRRALDYAGPLVSRVDERILEAIPSQERKGFLDALLNIVSVLGDVPSSENEKPSRKSAPGRAAPRKAASRKRPAKKAR
ncbi:MAG: MarR family winged helix-turn-helix transcriptional regulator [Pseudomonadota bacterium]